MDSIELLRILGGLVMITGWLAYHFFEIPFIEAIKLVILGIVLILGSFLFEYDRNKKEIKID